MKPHKSTSHDCFLIDDGLFSNLLAKQKLFDTQNKLAILGICIAWLPLLIISAFEGTLSSGVQMPFLNDVAMHSRLLIALPMMFLIKASINHKVMNVTNHIIHELIHPEERDQFIHKAFYRARRLISSSITEIIMLLIVIASTVSMVKGGVYTALESGKTSWMATIVDGTQKLSIAGYWTVCVSLPLTQFIILRWVWRYFIWVLMLLKISRVRLDLLPTHADKAGGLGIIILAQRSFALLFVAIGIILSGQLIAMILDDPGMFSTIRHVVFGFIFGSIILLILPLAFFINKLYKTKSEGLLNLGNLSAGLSGKFEREWVNDTPVDKILEEKNIDPSLIYDYNSMYNLLEELRIVPATIHDIMAIGAMLFIPFIPIIFIHFSLMELIQKIGGMVM